MIIQVSLYDLMQSDNGKYDREEEAERLMLFLGVVGMSFGS